MPDLTSEAQAQLRTIAERHGVSFDAARELLDALQRGGGGMAQFNHPELGGYGQWMRGGMVMVGDMFNNGLKSRVDALCNDLLYVLDSQPFVPTPSYDGSAQSSFGGGAASGGNWWPSELGHPNSSGAQNDMRYAYFAGARRLAVQRQGVVTVYDTLDHQIGGVSQQQGGRDSLSFQSQYGQVDLLRLPLVSNSAPQPSAAPLYDPPQVTAAAPSAAAPSHSAQADGDPYGKLERLWDLKQKGVISEEEFAAKKAELLARL